jgi:hypothetical protein
VVSLGCKEAVAFEIEKQSLKEVSEIKDSITSPFQHLGFMIKAFDKTLVCRLVKFLVSPIM